MVFAGTGRLGRAVAAQPASGGGTKKVQAGLGFEHEQSCGAVEFILQRRPPIRCRHVARKRRTAGAGNRHDESSEIDLEHLGADGRAERLLSAWVRLSAGRDAGAGHPAI